MWFLRLPRIFYPDPRLDQVLASLQRIITIGTKNMATLQDITDAVAAEKTVELSVIALLTKIAADLSAALAGQDPAAMQAVVDMIHANTDALSAAVTAGTPAAA